MSQEPRMSDRERLEARVVAWLLGEASAFEAAQLEDRLKHDVELAEFAERSRRTIGVLYTALDLSETETSGETSSCSTTDGEPAPQQEHGHGDGDGI